MSLKKTASLILKTFVSFSLFFWLSPVGAHANTNYKISAVFADGNQNKIVVLKVSRPSKLFSGKYLFWQSANSSDWNWVPEVYPMNQKEVILIADPRDSNNTIELRFAPDEVLILRCGLRAKCFSLLSKEEAEVFDVIHSEKLEAQLVQASQDYVARADVQKYFEHVAKSGKKTILFSEKAYRKSEAGPFQSKTTFYYAEFSKNEVPEFYSELKLVVDNYDNTMEGDYTDTVFELKDGSGLVFFSAENAMFTGDSHQLTKVSAVELNAFKSKHHKKFGRSGYNNQRLAEAIRDLGKNNETISLTPKKATLEDRAKLGRADSSKGALSGGSICNLLLK